MVCFEALALRDTLSTLNFRHPFSAISSRVACKMAARDSALLRWPFLGIGVFRVIGSNQLISLRNHLSWNDPFVVEDLQAISHSKWHIFSA